MAGSTVHRDFVRFSKDARDDTAGRVMVLGTNAITIARDARLLDTSSPATTRY
jgi:hypothetical protein